ncbi:MAG: PEGA domain-containing protein [Thermoguttaceae bacterium]|jgi:tetratricopeptide (TPR) repeat protein
MNFLNKPAIVFFHLFYLGILGFFDTKPISAQEPTTELYVRTTPAGAKVFLDGKELGVTPDLFEVEPGTAKIVVKLEGYDPIEKELEIHASRVTKLELEFKKAGQAIEQDRGTNRGGRNILPWPSASKDLGSSTSEKDAFAELLKVVEEAKREAKEGKLIDAHVTLEKARKLIEEGREFREDLQLRFKDLALHQIVCAYVELKDFPRAITTAKDINNRDRKNEAFLNVVMGAVQAGDTETAIDYSHQIEKDYRVVLTELYPSKTKKLKELLNQEANRNNSQSQTKAKATVSASKDSESSESDKTVFVEVLKLVEKAKKEAKEGKIIDARLTLEKAHDLTMNLELNDQVRDTPKDKALHEIVRAYIVLKDFDNAYNLTQEIRYSERCIMAERDVILEAERAGETETATHYLDIFKNNHYQRIGANKEIEKLLKKFPDPDGPVFEEVKKMVEKAQQQAKEGDTVGAHRTLEKASGLAMNMRAHYLGPTESYNAFETKSLDCFKYKALQIIAHAYVNLKDFDSALSTANEIWCDDRRGEAFLDALIGAARAGETETAVRYLDQFEKERKEYWYLVNRFPTKMQELKELLDKKASHDREPTKGKGSKPRN